MIAKQAKYLLRFDDLCPTMSRERWERFLPVFEDFGIRPILAVVPENRDPELEISAPDAEFWSRMRVMQAAGAAIGLHGYRHVCESTGRSLVPLLGTSDGFARVPFMRGRVTWIPQQLWAPVEKQYGVWTICIHSQTATDTQVEQLRSFLFLNSAQFTSLDEVLDEFQPKGLDGLEMLYGTYLLGRVRISKLRRSLLS